MNDPTVVAEWGLGGLALVALALLLFSLAIASGRWAAWLAGYIVVVVLLALALLATPAVAGGQPSAASGVLDDAARSGAATTRALATDGST